LRNNEKIRFIIGSILLVSFSFKNDAVVLTEPKLIIKIVLDETQERLGNNGIPVAIPTGNAGQSPLFNGISAHYLELAQSPYTLLGQGEVLYHAPETANGGENAIDFSKAIIRKSKEVFLEIPLKDITPGEYEWVRLSVSYQNYDIQFYYNNIPYVGTIASFVGFNNYITSYKIKNQTTTVHANKKQGYWGFESISGVQTGQSPAGATTVPNPLFATSPIPAGSCVITGKFEKKLLIHTKESKNITLTMNLSINKSFEWIDRNGNGKWDVDSNSGENVVDMGLRGLIPVWEKDTQTNKKSYKKLK
jgi:hypothetical protein